MQHPAQNTHDPTHPPFRRAANTEVMKCAASQTHQTHTHTCLPKATTTTHYVLCVVRVVQPVLHMTNSRRVLCCHAFAQRKAQRPGGIKAIIKVIIVVKRSTRFYGRVMSVDLVHSNWEASFGRTQTNSLGHLTRTQFCVLCQSMSIMYFLYKYTVFRRTLSRIAFGRIPHLTWYCHSI